MNLYINQSNKVINYCKILIIGKKENCEKFLSLFNIEDDDYTIKKEFRDDGNYSIFFRGLLYAGNKFFSYASWYPELPPPTSYITKEEIESKDSTLYYFLYEFSFYYDLEIYINFLVSSPQYFIHHEAGRRHFKSGILIDTFGVPEILKMNDKDNKYNLFY